MAKTDLKLSSTSASGDKITTTISDVNPAASNLTLKTFAQKLNMLTTNTYEETNKVTTVKVDTTDDKPQATLGLTRGGTLVSDTITASSDTYYAISTNSTSPVYYNFEPNSSIFVVVGDQPRSFKFTMPGTFTLYQPEDSTYSTTTKVYTIVNA